MLETPESHRHFLGDSTVDWAISRKGRDMSEHDLHWLGGVWDGEGCFSLVTARNHTMIMCMCRLTNTSDVMIYEAVRILDAAGLAYHLQKRNPTKGKKQVWHLSIAGMKRCRRFLDAIRPYVRTKANEADLMWRFIASRQARPVGAPLSVEEVDCFVQLRDIHGYNLSKSSETLRLALLTHSEQKKIKSALRQKSEKAIEPKDEPPASSLAA